MRKFNPFFCLRGFSFILLCSVYSSFAETPPNGTWEAWILQLKKNPSRTPRRPDGKTPTSELPLWVDCHLSWLLKNHLIKKAPVKLQSNAQSCAPQLENYSVLETPH